ncbi:MAG: hypothetical protein AXA67_00235 [Methylothermaceae bacteria B42]|nr:MAG: hypothetical protein AXA67_00235 [Methylothermaceae bacteria B42]HHJ38856.1 hypothetical protein [Methylothermaceae bacterium]
MSSQPQLEPIDVEVLLELYRQACINAREHIELRYKRFALFVAITAIIGAATFSITDLHPYHIYVAIFGILMTILFWILDHRTRLFYEVKCRRILACEKLLGVTEYFVPYTEEAPPGIPMRILMHLIFATVLLGWITIEALFIFQP